MVNKITHFSDIVMEISENQYAQTNFLNLYQCAHCTTWSFGIRHQDGNCPPIFEIFTTFTQPAQSSVELSDQVPFLFTIHFELIQFDNMPNFQPIKTEMPEVGGQSGQLPTHIWSAKPVPSNYLLFLLIAEANTYFSIIIRK